MRLPRAWLAFVAMLAVLFGGSRIASAHGVKTAYLEIIESAPGRAAATWRLPTPSQESMPVFPSACAVTQTGEGDLTATRSQRILSYRLDCAGSLAGEEIRVDGLGLTVTTVVVRVVLASHETHAQVLSAEEPSFVVRIEPGGAANGVLVRFARLGWRHVLGGADHLLFVLGLIFLARRPRQIVVTATTFTVAHSISLAAASLSWIRVPSAPAEACIALSLVLVALDIGRVRRERAPIGIAFGFGLVHGLGFAGGLTEVGLPKGALVTALLSFNLGVEAAQLAFIVACLGASALVVRVWPARRALLGQRVPLLSAYLVGGVGAYLALVRIESMLRGL